MLLADLYELPNKSSKAQGHSGSGNSDSGQATHSEHSKKSSSSDAGGSVLETKPPSNSTSPTARAAFHRAQAKLLRSAILDLFWDPKKLAFYDFNRTANARGTVS